VVCSPTHSTREHEAARANQKSGQGRSSEIRQKGGDDFRGVAVLHPVAVPNDEQLRDRSIDQSIDRSIQSINESMNQ